MFKGVSCRKSLRFSANGGELRTEQLLKLWLFNLDNATDKKSHIAWHIPEELPSLAELDRMGALQFA
jgi:hypothetical protein